MKKLRKLLVVALALTVAIGSALPAMAASYDVTSSDEIAEAVEKHSNNAPDDKDVIINMKNDITMIGSIDTQKDWKYVINGNGFVLADTTILGGGTVEINADLVNDGAGTALSVIGNTEQKGERPSVTVNGDISSWGSGVMAMDCAGLEINGDIDAQYTGATVIAGDGSESSVTINGDIDASNDGVSVSADNNTEVSLEVNGNISSETTGILSMSNNGSRTDITVNGDVTLPSTEENSNHGVSIENYGGSTQNYTQNGNIEGEAGLYLDSQGSDIGITINGNVDTMCGNTVYADSSNSNTTDITVNGNITVNENYYDACDVMTFGEDQNVNLNINGDVKTGGGDAFCMNNSSANGDINLNLKGNISGLSEDCGIELMGESDKAEINVVIQGTVDYPIYTYEGSWDQTVKTAVQRTVVPGSVVFQPPLDIPMSFETEDLDGNTVSSQGQDGMILVFFDPAHKGSCDELAKAQKLFEEGKNVYGVCLTEDYEAARALAEELGLGYPVLKNCTGLEDALASVSVKAPQVSLLAEGGMILDASRFVEELSPNGRNTAGPDSYTDTPIEIIYLNGAE